jgi:hypothetical protein
MQLPPFSDLPQDAHLYIKEFDVPLAQISGLGWVNYFGGRPRTFDPIWLKPGNHWAVESREEWMAVVRNSMS